MLFLLKKTKAILTHHFGCLPPFPGATAVSHGQQCQMLKRCSMKGMDVLSPLCQNEVIHQCYYSGFVCVLACIQTVLGLLQLAKTDSLNSCKTYNTCCRQTIPSNNSIFIYTFVDNCQPDKKLSKMFI